MEGVLYDLWEYVCFPNIIINAYASNSNYVLLLFCISHVSEALLHTALIAAFI